MIDLNIQIEELISNNATDFQISKVFKTYYKHYLDSIDTTVETTGGKDFFIKHKMYKKNHIKPPFITQRP